MESKNSAYLLDKNSTKFYEELRQRDLDEERKIKQQEAIELQRFKQLREREESTVQTDKNISLGSISRPAILPRKNLQRQEKTHWKDDCLNNLQPKTIRRKITAIVAKWYIDWI